MLFASQGINKVVGFIFLPYLSRILTKTDFGTYGQTLLVGNLGLRLFSFGLATVIFVFYAQNIEKRVQVFQTNLYAILGVGFTASLIGHVFAYELSEFLNNDALPELIRIYVWIIPLMMMNSAFDSTMIFFNKIKKSATILVVTNLISISLLVLVITCCYSLENLILAIILGHLIKFVFFLTYLPRELFKPRKIDFSLLRNQLWLGLPIGLTGVLGYLFKYTDGLMVSNLLTIEDYAIYRNGAIELPFVAAFYGSMTKLVLPDVSKYFAANKFKEIVFLKRKIINYNSVIIFPVALYLMVMSSPLITLYLSEKYSTSASVFAIYTSLLLIRVNNYGDIFTAASKNFYQIIIFSIVIIINIPLNFFFIKNFGVDGAALSTVLSTIILVILLLYKSTHILDFRIREFIDFKYIGKVFFLTLFLIILIKLIYNIYNTIPVFILLSLLYFTLSYFVLVVFRLIPLDIIILINKKTGLIPKRFLDRIDNYYNV